MINAIVVTPVKDSLETTKLTIQSVLSNQSGVSYYVFNDFSGLPTNEYLKNNNGGGFSLINLSDHTTSPSPNYKLVLQMSQQMALDKDVPLIIVESDIMVKKDTIQTLVKFSDELKTPGMIGAITVDDHGKINFPYNHINTNDPGLFVSDRSLSFCCTLLTPTFLRSFDFAELKDDKDWYDVHISKKSRSLGFKNYIAKCLPVIHRPHSSRPWKMEKYTNPISYYFKKIFLRRDKI